VLVAVRGHPFDRTAFDSIFQRVEGIAATMVDQPAAARLIAVRSSTCSPATDPTPTRIRTSVT
jgi:hypothetical protein